MIKRCCFLWWVVSACPIVMAGSPVPLCQPWRQAYTGTDASGKQVIGLWSFDGPNKLTDHSGHGHDAVLQGAKVDPDGRFGACLRSFAGWPVADVRHQALVGNDRSLSPKGAFTLELWINADKAFDGYPEALLIDKKYVADTDYQLVLSKANGDGLRRLHANLGFGTRSVSWYSDPLPIAAGTWYHVAFAYDGKGTGRFFVDGRPRGRKYVGGLGSIQAGTHPLSIGDRIGSYYHGFPGRIDQVRLCRGALEFRPARIERVSDRTCYVRMEKNISLQFTVRNLQRRPWTRATLTWTLDGIAPKPVVLENVASGTARPVTYRLNTQLRPDEYRLAATLAIANEDPSAVRETFPVRIVARRPADRFPVVMWGAGPDEIARLQRIGFTHALGIGADYARIWKATGPVAAADPKTVRATRRALDQALAAGMTFAASLSPGSYLRGDQRLLRVDRAGKPYLERPDICGLFPEIAPFCQRVGASVARTYGDLPAFGAALLHTEVRDAARPCFHPHDAAALRRDAGIVIPDQIQQKWGVNYTKLADFPANHVIADNNPIYVYYRWYWKRGDGWNALNSALHRGLKSMNRDDFWTWHDPAARVASVYGSGGDVDVLSQWTYSYPDPIRIGVATDELLAMARGGRPDQKVMKMTQIIWYRSQTAPRPKRPDAAPAYQARWERQQPDARFITIPPMHLREAFWTKIARPIKGIMYHGWQSLVPTETPSSYQYTHPETQYELQRLIRTVVRPLGPTLLHISAIKSDVAFYESFAAEMFAGRGTYGWSGNWLGDGYQAVMWAGLQPEIVFDETITDQGLDQYKILFMLDCDVLTASVLKRVRQFQRRGGLVIGDDRLAPAVKADIRLTPYQRTNHAKKDKTGLLRVAARLRRKLNGRYPRYVDSSNPEVIPYRRRYRDADYVFLVNDRRQYGHYVGHHGRVMENGLPSTATVTIARDGGAIYDLVEHREVSARANAGRLTMDVQLGPCAGRALMITARAIQRVVITVPPEASRGGQVPVTIKVVGNQGVPINAVVPVAVNIEDATGRTAEYSGYWAARDGRLKINLDIAPNAPVGTWTIHVRELAAGQTANGYVKVQDDGEQATPDPADGNAANPVQPNG